MSGGAHVRRSWRYLELQFRGDVTQTRMSRWFPQRLHIGYTRTMLAALWLHPQPQRIGIIGLGGGAQTKFCHRNSFPLSGFCSRQFLQFQEEFSSPLRDLLHTNTDLSQSLI